MPPLEAFCGPYSTHHVGRNLPWKRQKKTLLFVCSKASLTDGNFSIYSAIRHFTIFQKAALLVKIFLYYGPFFHRLAKKSLRMISAALIALFPFFPFNYESNNCHSQRMRCFSEWKSSRQDKG